MFLKKNDVHLIVINIYKDIGLFQKLKASPEEDIFVDKIWKFPDLNFVFNRMGIQKNWEFPFLYQK